MLVFNTFSDVLTIFRRIASIRVTQMYVDDAHVRSIRTKGPNDYQADLFFRDAKMGVNKVCMIATDSNG